MLNINTFGRRAIADVTPISKSAWISITDPGTRAISGSGFDYELHLQFWDVETGEGKITIDQAREIVDFITQTINEDVTNFYINCEQGLSRSTGIAVAMEDFFNNKDVTSKYPYHNKLVRRSVLRQLDAYANKLVKP